MYEIVDYKTGKCINWATGEIYTHENIHNNFQLRFYHLVCSMLFPEKDHFSITIFYLNDGGPITTVFDKNDLPYTLELIREKFEEIEFKGYAAKYKTSEVSGLDRLYYDRNEPYTKTIKQWNNFEPALTVEKPIAYLIPKAWDKVIKLLVLNNVKVHQLKSDLKLEVEAYYIADMKTAQKPFEGHYLHSAVKVETKAQTINYYEGDYVVYVNQKANRYIVEKRKK